MQLIILGLLLAVAQAFDGDLENLLNFHLRDGPIITTSSTTSRIENISRSCTCVPYYSCEDDKTEGTVTPVHGDLDYRPELNEEQCLDSLEVCCKRPKDLKGSKPQPDSAKIKGCGYRNLKGIGPSFKHANTQFGEFPWVVALLDSRNSSYAGVGVLISPEVVMTGAHIAYKFSPDSLKIRAGEWNTQSLNELYEHQERQVKEIYVHEEFNPKNLKNDIALLRLEQPVQLSEHINVICLPEQGEVFDSHKNCIANGWGKDVFARDGVYSVILKKVETDIVPHEQCNTLLRKTRLGVRFNLHDSFLCAGGDEKQDGCRGDGGAPLACPIGDDRYKLTGLVAWGIGCGQKDVPAVYTNVPKYRDWVDDKMADWGLQAAS